MYIIMRKDLAKAGWSGGSIAAQACHATTAVLAKHWTHPRVVSYLGDLANMHKVVLGVKNLGKLEGLCGQMAEAGIEFERWVEQPENTLTAVATLPQSRSQAVPFFKAAKCELWR
ncbi:peptidyl-tRNA hydrolase domain-containing protein 1 [Polyrhizophydium stewartii]|uniref:peptidyl-tRNA hydrolase n=1 Tax=Polyrhizophydium stewartii TaxID=2732419 RepID=A0ABR4NFX9_9FUNG